MERQPRSAARLRGTAASLSSPRWRPLPAGGHGRSPVGDRSPGHSQLGGPFSLRCVLLTLGCEGLVIHRPPGEPGSMLFNPVPNTVAAERLSAAPGLVFARPRAGTQRRRARGWPAAQRGAVCRPEEQSAAGGRLRSRSGCRFSFSLLTSAVRLVSLPFSLMRKRSFVHRKPVSLLLRGTR